METEALVRQAKSGDPQAIGSLCERYHPLLCRYLYALTRSRPAAEDLAQDTLLLMLRGLPDYRNWPGGRFEGWLFRIAHNRFVSEARKRRPSALPEGYDPPDPVGAPDQNLIDRERKRALEGALCGLDEELRELVVLRYELELGYREIAGALDISPAKVKWRLHDALEKLRKTLKPEDVM